MVFLREKYTNCGSIPNGHSSIGQPGKAKKLHLDRTTCGQGVETVHVEQACNICFCAGLGLQSMW